MNQRESDNEKLVIRSAPLQQGALVTIILFSLIHLSTSLMWGATITERLRNMSSDMLSMKNSVGNYIEIRSDLNALTDAFKNVRDNGSPITDSRLKVLEYQMKEMKDRKV